jgi:hypothetical protein
MAGLVPVALAAVIQAFELGSPVVAATSACFVGMLVVSFGAGYVVQRAHRSPIG